MYTLYMTQSKQKQKVEFGNLLIVRCTLDCGLTLSAPTLHRRGDRFDFRPNLRQS